MGGWREREQRVAAFYGVAPCHIGVLRGREQRIIQRSDSAPPPFVNYNGCWVLLLVSSELQFSMLLVVPTGQFVVNLVASKFSMVLSAHSQFGVNLVTFQFSVPLI